MNCAERSYSNSLYPTAAQHRSRQSITNYIAGHQQFGEQLAPVWSGPIGSLITRIMSHVKHNLARLPDFLKQSRCHYEGSALQPLHEAERSAELEKTYAMAEVRAVRRGHDAIPTQESEILFFQERQEWQKQSWSSTIRRR